ncbi:hypothetical protein [Cohnella cellulosilytica]|uniref:DUF4179 domain-containing protein n=1 Tax=Cohnella cellulosilytica TaxID=986710 RepID=A0ABW2FDH8_9BACL
MKIKISEMFERIDVNVDAIKIEEDSRVDKDKIRKMALDKINAREAGTAASPAHRKTSRRTVVLAAAAAALLAAALGANAATGGKLFGAIVLNDDNRHLAQAPDYASMREESPGSSINDVNKTALTSTIIREEQLQSVNAGSITNIALEEQDGRFLIPQLLTGNGDLVIFTKEEGGGWELEPGDELSIRFKLDLTHNYSDPNGEYMELGFIRNGEPIKGSFDKTPSFDYTVTADEAGVYYLYTENYSAGKIIIDSGAVSSTLKPGS